MRRSLSIIREYFFCPKLPYSCCANRSATFLRKFIISWLSHLNIKTIHSSHTIHGVSMKERAHKDTVQSPRSFSEAFQGRFRKVNLVFLAEKSDADLGKWNKKFREIKDRQNTENQRRNSFECWIFWVKKTVSGTLSACFFYCRQYSFSLIYGIFRGLKREFSHDTAVFSFIIMKLNSVSTKFYSVRTSFYVHTYEKYFCTYVRTININFL